MGLTEGSLEFAIILHLGTIVAVTIAYHKSIFNMIKEFFLMLADLITFKGLRLNKSKYRRYIILIIIASVPAGIVGVLFDDFISDLFSSVIVVSITLIITGFLLLIGDSIGKGNQKKIEQMSPLQSFMTGIFQMFAIMPGISRSGSTIVGGLLSGLDREEAVEFSFLMSLPAVLGSSILKLGDISAMAAMNDLFAILAGFFTAVIIGYFSIKLLVAIVKKGDLIYFSTYCWTLSILLIINTFLF